MEKQENISKAWDWKVNTDNYWLEPSDESYYLTHRWKKSDYKDILDFGCGLGRHAIHFAKEGFNVFAFDLSETAVEHVKQWAEKEKVQVEAVCADMQKLPYEDNSFDCIFAYHVISHTDTMGMKVILKEIERVMRPDGEIFLTLCSKETWSFKDAGYPKLDANTVIKVEDGPENGVPHFYVTAEDILELMSDFEMIKMRHIDDCYWNGALRNSKHYFVVARKK